MHTARAWRHTATSRAAGPMHARWSARDSRSRVAADRSLRSCVARPPMRNCALVPVLIAIACHAEPTTSAPTPAAAPAARDVAPAPSTAAPSSVADASVEAMNADAITCVLADRRVAQYLHAELPGRVPVKLH